MPKKAFVPPISAGLQGKSSLNQRKHVAKRIHDHLKPDLPIRWFTKRTKQRIAENATVAAAGVDDDIQVNITGIDLANLGADLRVWVEAVGIKTDDVLIVNQVIHIGDGTFRQWTGDDGIVHTIENVIEDPEEAFYASIRRAVAAWE